MRERNIMKYSIPQQRKLLREIDEKTRREIRKGDADSETETIKNKLRTGELTEKNIRAAAALGWNTEAVNALGYEPIKFPGPGIYYKVFQISEESDLTSVEFVGFAVDCAKRVLSVFESRFPDDDRPRRAIETAEGWLSNPSGSSAYVAAADAADASAAAVAARYAAAAAAIARSAARSAASSARSAAHAHAARFAHAVAYAAYAANYADAAGLSEGWMISRLIEYLIGKEI
jgi:hypothetical protein